MCLQNSSLNTKFLYSLRVYSIFWCLQFLYLLQHNKVLLFERRASIFAPNESTPLAYRLKVSEKCRKNVLAAEAIYFDLQSSQEKPSSVFSRLA